MNSKFCNSNLSRADHKRYEELVDKILDRGITEQELEELEELFETVYESGVLDESYNREDFS